jgi:hypothetical protein
MPYESKWTPPELFLDHQGVKLYHTYKDDEASNGPSRYCFTTDPTNEFDCYERERFDVQELDVPACKLLENHPPYLSETDDFYRNGTKAQRAEFRRAWERWQSGGEEAVIAQILREAIEAGLIKAREPGEDELDDSAHAHGSCAGCTGGCGCGGHAGATA